MSRIKKKNYGFSLVEVLVAMIIFSSVMIVSVSIMIRSARVSRNNEIKGRSNLLLSRVVENLTLPGNTFPNCNASNTDITLTSGTYYSINDIDVNLIAGEKICLTQPITQSEISTCKNGSSVVYNDYSVEIKYPTVESAPKFSEIYCVQIFYDNIPGSTSKRITARVVYDSLTQQNIVNELYSFKHR